MRQRLKIAFVVVLVLANAGLLFLLKEKSDDSRAETAKASPVAPSTSATSATPEPESSSAPGGEQGLAVAGDDAIFRIYGGSCRGKEGAGISVSTDSGATFDDVTLPARIRAVFTLTAKDAKTLDLVAAGRKCEPLRFASTDGGSTWEAAEGADVWFLDQQRNLTAPVGKVDPGCTEIQILSAVDAGSARVLCASGTVLTSNDGGKTWTNVGSLGGVKAAAYLSKRQGYALAPDGGCPTGTYSTVDAGRNWTSTGCLDAAPARALAANQDLLAAIVGDSIYISEDAGRNWRRTS